MLTQKYLIRGVASFIALIKRRELHNPHLKLLVFTGTSGKTTTRDAVAFGLRSIGQRVESNHVGYTNELGILLTAFGIPEASFKQLSTWRAILRGRFIQNTYVCIESGADFADDLPWLLRRFTPHAVFLGGITHEPWAGNLERTREQRKRLIRAIPKDGLIVYDANDEMTSKDVVAAQLTAQTRSISLLSDTNADLILHDWTRVVYTQPAEDLYNAHDALTLQDNYEDRASTTFKIQLNRAIFEPQALALLAAYAFLRTQFPTLRDRLNTLFDDYSFSHNRLQLSRTSSGALLIEDSYKATPFCTTWFLEMAQRIKAKKKILVLSELRPLEVKVQETYARIGEMSRYFDQVYFVGPESHFAFLQSTNQRTQLIKDATAPQFAHQLAQATQKGDAIFLKGSFRYKLDELREKLTRNEKDLHV